MISPRKGLATARGSCCPTCRSRRAAAEAGIVLTMVGGDAAAFKAFRFAPSRIKDARERADARAPE
jgi:hypothetical protein